ncbi:MAG: ABC transporter ATP-binding protein/permease [Lachnospiraceae bacterium]|nr:ABC transporter ATP-binding protein/permease [Lachnospiraceae bacterium]
MYKLGNVNKIYSQGEQSVTALSDINLSFGYNGIVGVVGESGSGKTTLLNLLSGLDKVSEGEILFCDKKISSFNDIEWDEYHSKDVGFIFQDYNVIDELTIEENINLALEVLDIDEFKKKQMIDDALAKVGLKEIRSKLVGKLSGGQKQRVAIARAYVKKPKVILADEPTGNLDYENSVKIFSMLKEISNDTLVIIITHSKSFAMEYADRMITLSDGKVVSDDIKEKEVLDIEISSGDNKEIIKGFEELTTFIKDNSVESNRYEIVVHKKKINIKDEKKQLAKKEEHGYKTLKRSIKFMIAKKILEKRRVRQYLSIGIFAITVFLMYMVTNFMLYNEHRVISEYLTRYDISDVRITRELESMYKSNKRGTVAYRTKEMKEDLLDIVKDNIYYEFLGCMFSNDDMMYMEGEEIKENVFYEPTGLRVLTDKVLSQVYNIDELKINEFIISEGLAKKTGITKENIGETYYIDDEKHTLLEIVSGNESKVYVSEKYVERIKKENKETSGRNVSVSGNFIRNKSLYEYRNHYIALHNAELMEYTDLIGRMPSEKHEVVISNTFFYDNKGELADVKEPQELIEKSFELIDLYDEKYKTALTENMNLYDYLGERVTIVGVAQFDGDVLVCADVYKKLNEDYYSIYCFETMGCYSTSWKDLTKHLHETDFRIEDENIKDVYKIVDMRPILMKYIVGVIIIMVVLTMFLMISLISYSVKDNGKTIGILKSQGICKKDLKHIFAISPAKNIFVSLIFALIVLLWVVSYINKEYNMYTSKRIVEILPTSVPSIIITLVLTVILAVVSLIWPLKMMDRKTIIDNIKN